LVPVGAEIHDCQATMAESDPPLHEHTLVVGAAVLHRPRHRTEGGFVGIARTKGNVTGDSTHARTGVLQQTVRSI
jgi:hypothetical protein